ncbi:hypothetical protein FLAG1_06841 [Fusarium langsethiae]|uniref:Uncharacterized protein n=1 Tax=Fusarium langsethiae TaxID=179993 RepID=A0A0N0DDW2_FUSLA|nr:hypothetical protein FLAG1_06841 [Fusarium langsethiae]
MSMSPNTSRASQTIRRLPQILESNKVPTHAAASGRKSATARSRPRRSTTLFRQETLWLRARGHANPWAFEGLEHPSQADPGYSRPVSKETYRASVPNEELHAKSGTFRAHCRLPLDGSYVQVSRRRRKTEKVIEQCMANGIARWRAQSV